MGKGIVSAIAVIAFLVGMGAGYALTPEYAAMRQSRATGMAELGRADRYLDLRYVNGMIAHHRAAIFLSEQAKAQSKRPEVVALANTIIAADEAGIDALMGQKKRWYGDTKPVSQFNKVQLGQSDATFDLRFLNALIAHHDEAIAVAREVMTKSTRSDVLTLADSVVTSLNSSLATLKAWRKEWYGIN